MCSWWQKLLFRPCQCEIPEAEALKHEQQALRSELEQMERMNRVQQRGREGPRKRQAQHEDVAR